jgi:hypothetical protein
MMRWFHPVPGRLPIPSSVLKVDVYIKSCPQILTKVTKTKTALKQETYNPSDLKHDLHYGFVELGGSVSVSSEPTPSTPKLF